MSSTIGELTPEEAAGIGPHILIHAPAVAEAPPGASADVHEAAFSPLTAAAQKAQDDLVACIAAVTQAAAQREALVLAARAAEKEIDTSFAALCERLTGEAKDGTDGAAVLIATISPEGSQAVTRLSGRPQRGKYEAIYTLMTSAAVTSNPAYAAIAPKIGPFTSKLAAFGAAIDAKDSSASALAAARAQRDVARAGWTVAFRDLLATAARIQGETSSTYRAWIRPLLDLKAAQQGARTRRANAAEPPADVADTEG